MRKKYYPTYIQCLQYVLDIGHSQYSSYFLHYTFFNYCYNTLGYMDYWVYLLFIHNY